MDGHVLAANQGTADAGVAGSVHERGAPGAPRIDVRVVLGAIVNERLAVALTDDGRPGFSLLQGPAVASEALDTDARRIVRGHIGQQAHYLEQLYTLGVDEDEQWTVIVAYLALTIFAEAPVSVGAGGWFDVERLPPVGAADRMLIDYALIRLRAKIGYTTIAFHLLPTNFTLSELQTTYEAILGRRLDKRNFRRRVVAADFLDPTGAKRRDGNHRPAVVYRFRALHDRDQYLTPAWASET